MTALEAVNDGGGGVEIHVEGEGFSGFGGTQGANGNGDIADRSIGVDVATGANPTLNTFPGCGQERAILVHLQISAAPWKPFGVMPAEPSVFEISSISGTQR